MLALTIELGSKGGKTNADMISLRQLWSNKPAKTKEEIAWETSYGIAIITRDSIKRCIVAAVEIVTNIDKHLKEVKTNDFEKSVRRTLQEFALLARGLVPELRNVNILQFFSPGLTSKTRSKHLLASSVSVRSSIIKQGGITKIREIKNENEKNKLITEPQKEITITGEDDLPVSSSRLKALGLTFYDKMSLQQVILLNHISLEELEQKKQEAQEIFSSSFNHLPTLDGLQRAQTKNWERCREFEMLMVAINRPIIVLNRAGDALNLVDADRFDGEPIFVLYNNYEYGAFILEQHRSGREVLKELGYQPASYQPGVNSTSTAAPAASPQTIPSAKLSSPSPLTTDKRPTKLIYNLMLCAVKLGKLEQVKLFIPEEFLYARDKYKKWITNKQLIPLLEKQIDILTEQISYLRMAKQKDYPLRSVCQELNGIVDKSLALPSSSEVEHALEDFKIKSTDLDQKWQHILMGFRENEESIGKSFIWDKKEQWLEVRRKMLPRADALLRKMREDTKPYNKAREEQAILLREIYSSPDYRSTLAPYIRRGMNEEMFVRWALYLSIKIEIKFGDEFNSLIIAALHFADTEKEKSSLDRSVKRQLEHFYEASQANVSEKKKRLSISPQETHSEIFGYFLSLLYPSGMIDAEKFKLIKKGDKDVIDHIFMLQYGKSCFIRWLLCYSLLDKTSLHRKDKCGDNILHHVFREEDYQLARI